MRYAPLRPQGRRGVESDRIRAQVFPRLIRRSGGHCEGCGARAQDCGGLEWAHCFGRPGSGLGLGAWADSEQLTAALCRRCHNTIDRALDLELRTRLRWQAYERLSHRVQVGCELHPSPEDSVRELIRAADSAGVYPEEI